VFETVNLVEWKEMFHSATPTFARSLEIPDGDFYLWLGSQEDDVRPETGGLLRVRAQHYGRQYFYRSAIPKFEITALAIDVPRSRPVARPCAA
jgi:hypothetical protein